MSNSASIQGNQNISIQGVTDSTITLNVGGDIKEVRNDLAELKALLEHLQAQFVQVAGSRYVPEGLTERSLPLMLAQLAPNALPEELRQNLVSDKATWVKSLQQAIQQQGVQVGNRPPSIFERYGWLIETFLQKMLTKVGQERSLRRLSFMAEAFQSSLRYLVYVQVAQLLHTSEGAKHPAVAAFLEMPTEEQARFDYLNFLVTTTELLPEEEAFMPEIYALVEELEDTDEDLRPSLLFLQRQRNALLNQQIAEDEALPTLLDEYLTALVLWLRELAFLAKYRLVSIKDIQLSYRLGTEKFFTHLYGELHGMYQQGDYASDDYNTLRVENVFTYNQSVLLLKTHVQQALTDPRSYLSLSPLVIDQSVFSEKATQTPEVYYFAGKEKDKKKYAFAQYKNELEIAERNTANKGLTVKRQNNKQPKLNELFEQIQTLFNPKSNIETKTD